MDMQQVNAGVAPTIVRHIRPTENVFARSFAKHLSPPLHPESPRHMWHQFSWWLVLDGTVAGGN